MDAATTAGNALLTAVNFYFKGDNPESRLDPFATLVRLALYSRMDANTKLSIANNTITYQPPSIMQGAIRKFVTHDDRDRLFALKRPITRVIKLWPLNSNPKLKAFYEAALKAYEIFRDVTYKDWVGDKKDDCIDVVITLLQAEINSPHVPEELNEFEKKFKEVWAEDDITTAATLFSKKDKDCDDALKKFLDRQDRMFMGVIKSIV